MPRPPRNDDLITALREPLYSALNGAVSTVRLCSPFIGPGTAADLKTARRNSTAEWRLLTHLSARAAAYGSLDLDGLEEMLKREVTIRSLPGLHAKVFLLDDDEGAGFVGSANLTTSGLGGDDRHNRELTVALNAEQRTAAAAQFDAWWSQGTDVTTAMLRACAKEARKVPVTVEGEPTKADDDLLQISDDLLRDSASAQTWIKAVYRDTTTADDLWTAMPWMGSPGSGRPHFSVGDLVLIYAKDAKRCNAVLEVTDESRHDPDFAIAAGIPADHATRWPWITPIKVRLQVPVERGVPLARLGVTGQSLQPGHRRMPVGGLATALRYLCQLEAPDD